MPAPKLRARCNRRPVRDGVRFCALCLPSVLQELREKHPEFKPLHSKRLYSEERGLKQRSTEAIGGTPQDWPEGE